MLLFISATPEASPSTATHPPKSETCWHIKQCFTVYHDTREDFVLSQLAELSCNIYELGRLRDKILLLIIMIVSEK